MDRLILPRGDDYTAPIEAMERALSSLPLEDCELRRNAETGTLEFHAPAGKAFRLTGPELYQDRFKPFACESRAEATGSIPKDPLAVEDRDRWEADIGEHIARRLTVRVNHHVLGHMSLPQEEWTPYPYSVSSDDVQVNVLLLDEPQAWTETVLRALPWKVNNSSYARKHEYIVEDGQHQRIGCRQAFIVGDLDKSSVELVDIDYDSLLPSDDKVRSTDGRELQIAGQPSPRITDLATDIYGGMEADSYDEHWMSRFQEAYRLGEIDDQQTRVEILWPSRRNIIDYEGERVHERPFADDPLRDFDVIVAKNGILPDVSRLLEIVKRNTELSAMSPAELEELKERGPQAESFIKAGRLHFEAVPSEGSLSTTVKQHCGPGWELAAGQRRYNRALFGWYQFPHTWREIAQDIAHLSLKDVVGKYAAADWHLQDYKNRRLAHKRRDWEDYLKIIDPRPEDNPEF